MEQQGYYRSGSVMDSNVQSSEEPLIVNCTGIAYLEKPFSNRTVMREDYYLQYMTDGRLTAYPDGQPKEFSRGMFIIYRPHMPYHYELAEGETMSYYWAHFTGFHAGRLLANLGLEPGRIYQTDGSDRQFERITGIFQRMFLEFINRRPGFDDACGALLTEILVRLARGADKIQAGEMRKLETLAYLHSHFREETRIAELASMEHLSESRYRTVFRRHTGVSPGEYRIALRMQHACELLSQTDITVTEIAADCGYTDVLYFLRIFKNKIGMPPGEYRAQSRMNRDENAAEEESEVNIT